MARSLTNSIISFIQDQARLDGTDWGEEARLWGTAALLATIIILCIQHMTDSINRAAQCLWIKAPPSVRDSALRIVDAIETPIVRIFDPAAHACRTRSRGDEDRATQLASVAQRRMT